MAYSFAINYAISGLEVWSYHVFNLLVHLVNVLLVYGIARRVQGQALFAERTAGQFGHRIWALLLACLWAVHPLNSETVVYIAQRTELMMAAFFLAAFVTLPRAGREGAGPIYTLVTVTAGLLAVLCKETAAVLPLLLLLFDRAFIGGSFAVAWRERKGVYLGGLVLIAVAGVIASGDHRGGLVTDDPSITWRYLLTQGGVILHYLRLSVVPYPLAITYEWPLVEGLRDGWPAAGAVGVGLLLTCWALVRRPILGFLGASFYLLLAPTSSVIPIMSEVAGERRMYLPLLAVLVLAAWGGAVIVGGVTAAYSASRQHAGAGAVGFALAAVFVGAAVTVARVHDFRSVESIWRQTLRVEPESLFARSHLGSELIGQGRLDEAESLLLEIRVVAPNFPKLARQLGLIALTRGELAEAADHYFRAARSPSGTASDFACAGYVLMKQGKARQGQQALGEALRLDPDNSQALSFVALLLADEGRYDEAIVFNKKNLSMFPEFAEVWGNQGHNFFKIGDIDAARASFREAHRLEQESIPILRQFVNFEVQVKNYSAAFDLYRHWLTLKPHSLEALKHYAVVLVEAREDQAAGAAFQRLIALHPHDVDARQRYTLWLAHTGQPQEAGVQLQAARKLDPRNARTAEIAEMVAAQRALRVPMPSENDLGSTFVTDPVEASTPALPTSGE